AKEEAGHYPNFFERFVPQLRAMVSGVLGMVNPQRVVLKAQETIQNLNATIAAMSQGETAERGSNAFAIAQASTYARPLSAESRALLSQDYFGFRKLLLVSTASGKLYALESQSGSIVWSRFLRITGASDDQQHAHEE